MSTSVSSLKQRVCHHYLEHTSSKGRELEHVTSAGFNVIQRLLDSALRLDQSRHTIGGLDGVARDGGRPPIHPKV